MPPQQQNLKVSYNFIQWILTSNRGIMAHLYKMTSAAGAVDYFTDMDCDITYDNAVWKSTSLRFEGLHRKIGVGLNVDEQNLKIWAAPGDTLFGANFLANAEQGLLDGAVIVRYRAIWTFVTGNAHVDIGNQPIAVWPLFTGYTSVIGKGGTSHVEVKAKSALARLNVNMPRNYYQPGCLWTLYSPGCTLSKAAHAVTGTVGSTPFPPAAFGFAINGGVVSPTGADGIATYGQGRLLFTSGVNNGLQILIGNNDSQLIFPAYPLSQLPAVGDSVTYYPGCSKTYQTCQLKFGNQANYRGFDKVPPIMVSA